MVQIAGHTRRRRRIKQEEFSSSKCSLGDILLTLLGICISFLAGTLSSLITNEYHDCAPVGGENSMEMGEVQESEVDIAPISIPEEADTRKKFGPKTSAFAVGMAAVNKNEFFDQFDHGNPNHPYDAKSEVLILYSQNALPSNPKVKEAAMYGGGVPSLSVKDATQNCDNLDVVMSFPNQKNQCIAIVGGYESYHLQKWMRMERPNSKLDHRYPLIHVGRAQHPRGSNVFKPPTLFNIKDHWILLRKFLNTYEDSIKELQPILENVVKENTVIVMTCNFGQSALLLNFACSAKARGFDISNVLVFATDEETLELAQGLGMAAYYDEKNFGSLPSAEAKAYMDRTFVSMMYAKVVTVHLINAMGYDVLFQDVDIVWYQDPLSFLHNKTSPMQNFDVLFQRDGASTLRYAPYDANSGFYYVRHNTRTRYLFTYLLYSGDLIKQLKSHQAALQALLAEHSSLFGLRVKTLGGEEFPGGLEYHRKKTYMKDLAHKKITPWIFHMSWTKNKDNKLLFMKQMGMWYLQEKCLDKKVGEIPMEGGMEEACCAKEALVTCHYRDKPSIVPCKNSPPIDKGHGSFW